MANNSYYCHPSAVIDDGVAIGEGSKIWHFTHIREGVRIGKHCVIGQGVYIDADVHIGDYVHIQNGVNVYKGVTLHDRIFVGPCATFTNDLYPRSGSLTWKPIPTVVCTGASIGANATIICGVTIGEYAMVVAAACVTENVPPYGMVKGVPARLCGTVCQCGRPIRQNETGYCQCRECGFQIQLPYNSSVFERI